MLLPPARLKLRADIVEYVEVPTFREEPWESDRLAAEEFVQRARRLAGQVPTSVRPVVAVQSAGSRWSLRQRLLLIVLVGGFLVFVAVVLASLANSVR